MFLQLRLCSESLSTVIDVIVVVVVVVVMGKELDCRQYVFLN